MELTGYVPLAAYVFKGGKVKKRIKYALLEEKCIFHQSIRKNKTPIFLHTYVVLISNICFQFFSFIISFEKKYFL